MYHNVIHYIGTSIRTVGYAGDLNSSNDQLLLHYKDSSIQVDVRSLSPFNYHLKQTYQFIGEVKKKEGELVIIKARLYREMKGLDIDMYHKVQKLRQIEYNK